ncbi:MAG: hypothetical protein PVI85_06875, partial [Methyloceanibacter sp.]
MRRLILSLPVLILMGSVAVAEVASPPGALRPQHVAPPDAEPPKRDAALTQPQSLDVSADDEESEGDAAP